MERTAICQNPRAVDVPKVIDIGHSLGVNFDGRVSKPMAIEPVWRLEPYDLMFVDQPLLSEHVDGFELSVTRRPSPLLLANGSTPDTGSSSCSSTTPSLSSSPPSSTSATLASFGRSSRWPSRSTWPSSALSARTERLHRQLIGWVLFAERRHLGAGSRPRQPRFEPAAGAARGKQSLLSTVFTDSVADISFSE